MSELFVLTSLRQIRELSKDYSNSLLPKSITIGEFFSRAVVVRDLNEASPSQSLLAMSKACSLAHNASSVLGIASEFFAFLKNNDYLFSFFKEISHQKCSFDDLEKSDAYDSYGEHIKILNELYDNYTKILAQQRLYDAITLPSCYEINSAFLTQYKRISFRIDGLLSEFEWELVLQTSRLLEVDIYFIASRFNQKLLQQLAKISSINIEEFKFGRKFSLNLSSKTLTDLGSSGENRLVLTREFGVASLQAAFVFEKISTFIKDGIDAKNICVILPDESFAEILRLYDKGKMLSFAMGKSVKNTAFYSVLSRLCDTCKRGKAVCIKEDYFKNNDGNFTKDSAFFSFAGVSDEFACKFQREFRQTASFQSLQALLTELLNLCNEGLELGEILAKELFFMQNLLALGELSIAQACEFVLLRLAETSIDYVGGGEVRVMGLLESRGLSYDGVIIVDFNDELVPKRSVNEMFLSSEVRKNAGLVSYFDRENLQRFYYDSLVCSAKKVAISYVKNESCAPSRFLSEFDVVSDTSYDDESYTALFEGGYEAKFNAHIAPLKHDFFAEPLSFSRLSTFLICPRKYYYRYILLLKQARAFGGVATSALGVAYHAALCDYYGKYSEFDANKFLEILHSKGLDKLDFEIAKIKFQAFKVSEDLHFSQGWRVKEREISLENTFDNVRIKGVIDRIDERKNFDQTELCVIDYKSGKNIDELQLAFYKALLGGECESYFYDLGEHMSLVKKDADISLLSERLDDVRTYFSQEPLYEQKFSQNCQYCAYFSICKGELR